MTSGSLPELHDDDRLVADALRRRGFQVIAAVWSDPAVDWRQFASVVIRAFGDFRVQEELGGDSEPRDPSPAIVAKRFADAIVRTTARTLRSPP